MLWWKQITIYANHSVSIVNQLIIWFQRSTNDTVSIVSPPFILFEFLIFSSVRVEIICYVFSLQINRSFFHSLPTVEIQQQIVTKLINAALGPAALPSQVLSCLKQVLKIIFFQVVIKNLNKIQNFTNSKILKANCFYLFSSD